MKNVVSIFSRLKEKAEALKAQGVQRPFVTLGGSPPAALNALEALEALEVIYARCALANASAKTKIDAFGLMCRVAACRVEGLDPVDLAPREGV